MGHPPWKIGLFLLVDVTSVSSNITDNSNGYLHVFDHDRPHMTKSMSSNVVDYGFKMAIKLELEYF